MNTSTVLITTTADLITERATGEHLRYRDAGKGVIRVLGRTEREGVRFHLTVQNGAQFTT